MRKLLSLFIIFLLVGCINKVNKQEEMINYFENKYQQPFIIETYEPATVYQNYYKMKLCLLKEKDSCFSAYQYYENNVTSYEDGYPMLRLKKEYSEYLTDLDLPYEFYSIVSFPSDITFEQELTLEEYSASNLIRSETITIVIKDKILNEEQYQDIILAIHKLTLQKVNVKVLVYHNEDYKVVDNINELDLSKSIADRYFGFNYE